MENGGKGSGVRFLCSLTHVCLFSTPDPLLHAELAQSGHAEAAGRSDRAGGLHLRAREGRNQRGGGR